MIEGLHFLLDLIKPSPVFNWADYADPYISAPKGIYNGMPYMEAVKLFCVPGSDIPSLSDFLSDRVNKLDPANIIIMQNPDNQNEIWITSQTFIVIAIDPDATNTSRRAQFCCMNESNEVIELRLTSHDGVSLDQIDISYYRHNSEN